MSAFTRSFHILIHLLELFQVIRGVDKVNDATKTIYIGCEEDTAEALRAAKKRVWTFSSEWLMKCVLTQQLELQVTQFVESL